ncbi:MAG: DEAD/DEAH box helicase [Alphaproteobacteria bacterium]|nr:DEAD/DEAH box helicase [Alphaproteobacteria bacterium SS10]
MASLNRSHLHSYQERAANFIDRNPYCALWVDMGLGKTVSTLTALQDLRDCVAIAKVLIVAPLRVARFTWPDEIAAWDHIDLGRVVNMAGAPKGKREALLASPHDVAIINVENLSWLVAHARRQGRWPYDMVVLDEASLFKSPSAKRFKDLRKVLPEIHRLVELSGTPAPNGLLDIWSQLYLLDRGERLGKTMTQYKGRYFDQDYSGFNWTLKDTAAAMIHNKVSDLVLRLSADDYLDLPPRIDHIERVQLPAKARKQYDTLEREFLLHLDNDEVVTAVTQGVLAGKLLQAANGAFYLPDDGGVERIHRAKLDALRELIDAAAGEPVLVAYNYQFDKDAILAEFPQARVLDKRKATIDAWNAGEIPILIAHPASAGHGLNLQAGGSILIWYGLNWSLELHDQFNARLHRQGQTKPTRIYYIAADDTIDAAVLQSLKTKDRTQQALLAAVSDAARIRQTPQR